MYFVDTVTGRQHVVAVAQVRQIVAVAKC
jgi:hypothetical protein